MVRRYELVSRQLLRALRGTRTQPAFSRRLGYRSNVASAWESGRRFPSATELFAIARKLRIDTSNGFQRFFRQPPTWLTTADLTSQTGLALLLNELRGNAKLADVARRTGISRFSLGRWFAGHTEPRLPDFLRVIDALSLRLLDFLSVLVEPAALDSVAAEWARLQAQRQLAYDAPWSHAVLRVLELAQYRARRKHEPGFIARTLGISENEEQRCLRLLADAGQIKKRRGKWAPAEVLTVDTRHDPDAGHELRCWWAEVGLERLRAKARGRFAFNLFTVSNADFDRLQKLQEQYFQALRRIVSESEPAERVVLTNLQIFALEPAPARLQR